MRSSPNRFGGAHRDHRAMATCAQRFLVLHAIKELQAIPKEELLDRRYEKFRRFGVFEEALAEPNDTSDPPPKNGRPG